MIYKKLSNRFTKKGVLDRTVDGKGRLTPRELEVTLTKPLKKGDKVVKMLGPVANENSLTSITGENVNRVSDTYN